MIINSQILEKVFHAYDIRGLTPEQLDSNFFYELGKAFVTFLNAKNIAVGYDIRPESKVYSESFISGVLELGCNVVSLGQVATEMIYFAAGSNLELDGAITVTASHNPSGWSGAKMVGKGSKPLSGNWGLKEIKEHIQTQNYQVSSKIKGKLTIKNIFPEFKKKVLEFLGDTKIKPMNIVVDAGNGIGGIMFDYVFGGLGLKITPMYFEPDGEFPNHIPDPLKTENVKDIIAKVLETKADLGIAIDGDADRVFFIDKNGRNPLGIFTGAILGKYFAKKFKGAKIVHDPRVVWPIVRSVTPLGAIPLINQAGHSLFKERMKAEDAVLGTELSSHFFYRDFYYADSGMITIALFLKFFSEGLDFEQELDKLYSTYFLSGEVNYKVESPVKSIEKVKNDYKNMEINEIDGISIEFSDWRFNLRKSNTEPLLRLNVEASSVKALKKGFYEIESKINGVRQNLPIAGELKNI